MPQFEPAGCLRFGVSPVASYLRQGGKAILLADPQSVKRAEYLGYTWHDIHEEPIRFRDYVVAWDRRKECLRIQIDARVVRASWREVEAIAEGEGGIRRRHYAVVRHITQFLHRHRYAIGSYEVLSDHLKAVQKLVKKKFTAHDPTLGIPKVPVDMYNKLVLPSTNPFLVTATSPDTAGDDRRWVTNDSWMAMWNPYRGEGEGVGYGL